jgi:hypothetical protein
VRRRTGRRAGPSRRRREEPCSPRRSALPGEAGGRSPRSLGGVMEQNRPAPWRTARRSAAGELPPMRIGQKGLAEGRARLDGGVRVARAPSGNVWAIVGRSACRGGLQRLPRQAPQELWAGPWNAEDRHAARLPKARCLEGAAPMRSIRSGRANWRDGRKGPGGAPGDPAPCPEDAKTPRLAGLFSAPVRIRT